MVSNTQAQRQSPTTAAAQTTPKRCAIRPAPAVRQLVGCPLYQRAPNKLPNCASEKRLRPRLGAFLFNERGGSASKEFPCPTSNALPATP